jgi:hypothetical protein
MMLFLAAGSALALVSIMALHAAGAYYFWQRLRAGHNGVTFALLVHMLAIGQLLTVQVAVVALVAWELPAQHWLPVQVLTLLSRVVLLISSVYVVAIAKIEAGKPLKKQTWTRERLYRAVQGKG